jgi:hypothetical protein
MAYHSSAGFNVLHWIQAVQRYEVSPFDAGLRFADRFPEISNDSSLVSSDFSGTDGFGGTGRDVSGDELEMPRRDKKVERDVRL